MANYILLVTGGTGTGLYRLDATGSLFADSADGGYFDVKLGHTELSLSSTGGFSNFYGTFTFGVPLLLPFDISAYAAVGPGRTTADSASAQFNGVRIFDNNFQLNRDAVISLVLAPEPTFAWAIGLCLLGFVSWRSRRQFRHYPSLT